MASRVLEDFMYDCPTDDMKSGNLTEMKAKLDDREERMVKKYYEILKEDEEKKASLLIQWSKIEFNT